MTSRSDLLSALASILNKMTSAEPLTARCTSASNMASFILCASKKADAFFISLVVGDTASMFSNKYDNTLIKCDLPDPKNPETHTPIRSPDA